MKSPWWILPFVIILISSLMGVLLFKGRLIQRDPISVNVQGKPALIRAKSLEIKDFYISPIPPFLNSSNIETRELRKDQFLWIFLNFSVKWTDLPPLVRHINDRRTFMSGNEVHRQEFLSGRIEVRFDYDTAGIFSITMILEDSKGNKLINLDRDTGLWAFGMGCPPRIDPFKPNYEGLESTGISFYGCLLGGWIPAEWDEGAYCLRVVVRETISGLERSAEYKFVIPPDGGAIQPSPIDLSPGLIALSEEEMLQGWEEDFDATDRLAIDGLIATNYRVFRKTKGALEKEIIIHTYLFSTPEKARKYLGEILYQFEDQIIGSHVIPHEEGALPRIGEILKLDGIGDKAYLCNYSMEKVLKVREGESLPGPEVVFSLDNVVILIQGGNLRDSYLQGWFVSVEELMEICELQKEKIYRLSGC